MNDLSLDTNHSNVLDYFIVFSLFFIPMFYWPNHDTVSMKNLAWQLTTVVMVAMSYFFTPQRHVKQIFLPLLLIYSVLSLLTHGMNEYGILSVMVIFIFASGLQTMINHLNYNCVGLIKKSIVVLALLNCLSYFLERLGFTSPFNLISPSYLPSGFMVYPAHFSLLCAIGVFFAWEWKKYLCIPLALGLALSNEFSVWVGLSIVLGIIMHRRWSWWPIMGIVGAVLIGCFLFQGFLKDYMFHRFHVRLAYWIPIFNASWSRGLDGWGLNSYTYFVDKIVPNQPHGAWLELHSEPLQAFFEGGSILMTLIGFWVYSIKKMFVGAYYEKPYLFSFIVITCVAMGHSILHFIDCVWVAMIIYSIFHVEHYEADKKWDISNFKELKHAETC